MFQIHEKNMIIQDIFFFFLVWIFIQSKLGYYSYTALGKLSSKNFQKLEDLLQMMGFFPKF